MSNKGTPVILLMTNSATLCNRPKVFAEKAKIGPMT